jgi:hypothetical protein
MEIKTLVDNLVSTDDTKYRRNEIDEIINRREESIPLLIDILKKVLENPENIIEDENYLGHMYALMLLGHFKEKSAHEIVLKLFSLPEDIPYALFGDVTTENLPAILLNTCGGCFDGIKELALNTKVDEYCRGSALKAMMYGVVNGSISREEVLAFYRGILENRNSELQSDFFNELASCICGLYPQGLMDIIEECYEDGYIDPWYIEIDSFETALKAGEEKCLENIKRDAEYSMPEDIHSAMSWWACFEDNQSNEWTAGDYNTGNVFYNAASQKKKKKKRKISKASKKKNRKKK